MRSELHSSQIPQLRLLGSVKDLFSPEDHDVYEGTFQLWGNLRRTNWQTCGSTILETHKNNKHRSAIDLGTTGHLKFKNAKVLAWSRDTTKNKPCLLRQGGWCQTVEDMEVIELLTCYRERWLREPGNILPEIKVSVAPPDDPSTPIDPGR